MIHLPPPPPTSGPEPEIDIMNMMIEDDLKKPIHLPLQKNVYQPFQQHVMPAELFEFMNRDKNQFLLSYDQGDETAGEGTDTEDEVEDAFAEFAAQVGLSAEDEQMAEALDNNSWTNLEDFFTEDQTPEAEAIGAAAAFSAGVMSGLVGDQKTPPPPKPTPAPKPTIGGKRRRPPSVEDVYGTKKTRPEAKEPERPESRRGTKRPRDPRDTPWQTKLPPKGPFGLLDTFGRDTKEPEPKSVRDDWKSWFAELMADFPDRDNKDCPIDDFFEKNGDPKPAFFKEIVARARKIRDARGFSESEKEKMYRKLLRKFQPRIHPDQNPDCPELADQISKEVNNQEKTDFYSANANKVLGSFITKRSGYKNPMVGSMYKR